MHDFVSSVTTEERVAVVQKREVEGRGIVQEGRRWQTKEVVVDEGGGGYALWGREGESARER